MRCLMCERSSQPMACATAAAAAAAVDASTWLLRLAWQQRTSSSPSGKKSMTVFSYVGAWTPSMRATCSPFK